MEEEKKSKWQAFRARMKHNYRLVVMTMDSFEEVASYKISLLNVYVLISSIVVIVALFVISAIAFTPLKKYIPGYGDAEKDEVVMEAFRRISALEETLAAKQTLEDAIHKTLTGDVQTVDEISNIVETSLDSMEEVPLSGRQKDLHNELSLQEVGNTAQQSKEVGFMQRSSVPLEQLYFIAPVKGEISAGFMAEKNHFGVDVLAPKNTAVKAAADGYVFLSDWTLETGNSIGIQHANNTITFYKHNSVLLKKAGSYVKAGEAVAIIGNTGTLSSGPHLHFELWYNGKPVDAREYIRF